MRSEKETSLPANLEICADQKWEQLVEGLKRDVEEYRGLKGSAAFEQRSDKECRISNSEAKTAVVVTADLSAQNIHYAYEPEAAETAVPEGSFLSLRTSGRSADLYSADECLTTEQARLPDSRTAIVRCPAGRAAQDRNVSSFRRSIVILSEAKDLWIRSRRRCRFEGSHEPVCSPTRFDHLVGP